MRGGVGLVAGLVVTLAVTGCELLADRSATLMDAGPDAVAAGCISAGCVECEPLTASSCPASPDAAAADGGADASSPCSGGDCDGLPDGRDPWPTRCNALLLDERFTTVDKTRWGRSYDDLFIGVRSCGLLQWTAPPHFTIWAWLEPAAASALDADALAEVRLLPKLRGSWTLTLGLNVVSEDQNMGWPHSRERSCVLEHDEGTFRLSSRIQTDQGSSTRRVGPYKLDGNLVLQSWLEGTTHHCRVVPDTGKPVEVDKEVKGQLPAGTLKLTLSNDAVQAPYVWLWIDSLRVFAP